MRALARALARSVATALAGTALMWAAVVVDERPVDVTIHRR